MSSALAFFRLHHDRVLQSGSVSLRGVVCDSLVQTYVGLVVEEDIGWHTEVPPYSPAPRLLLEEGFHLLNDIQAIH